MIKDQKTRMPIADVYRKHVFSQGTFKNHKSKFRGIKVSDGAELIPMEDKNASLKRLLAYTTLDNAVLEDLLGKN